MGIFVVWEVEATHLHGCRPQRGAHDHHEGEGGLQWAARSRCHGALAAPPGLVEARGRAPIGGMWGRPDHLDGAMPLSRSMGIGMGAVVSHSRAVAWGSSWGAPDADVPCECLSTYRSS